MAQSTNYRERIIKIFTLLGGVYFFFEFLLPEVFLQRTGIASIHEDITLGFIAIGLVTFGLGIINLIMIHGARIIFTRKGWSNSLALIIGLLIMLGCSVYDWVIDLRIQRDSQELAMLSEFSKRIVEDAQNNTPGVPPLAYRVTKLKEYGKKVLEAENAASPETPPAEAGPTEARAVKFKEEFDANIQGARGALLMLLADEAQPQLLEKLAPIAALTAEIVSQKREILRTASEKSFGKRAYNFLFEGLFVSLGSAMFSLLGVYIAAAAYRAFRIRTFEASLMMIAAVIVILGQIPFGSWIYEEMPEIRNWLLRIPNSAVSRAIGIGASIAGLVIAFRMWFSIESRTFSKRKQ